MLENDEIVTLLPVGSRSCWLRRWRCSPLSPVLLARLSWCPMAVPCPPGWERGLCPPSLRGWFHTRKVLGLLLGGQPAQVGGSQGALWVLQTWLLRGGRMCATMGWLLLSSGLGWGMPPSPRGARWCFLSPSCSGCQAEVGKARLDRESSPQPFAVLSASQTRPREACDLILAGISVPLLKCSHLWGGLWQ